MRSPPNHEEILQLLRGKTPGLNPSPKTTKAYLTATLPLPPIPHTWAIDDTAPARASVGRSVCRCWLLAPSTLGSHSHAPPLSLRASPIMQARVAQRPNPQSPSQISAIADHPDSDDGQLQSGDEDDNGLDDLDDIVRNGKRKRPISVSYVLYTLLLPAVPSVPVTSRPSHLPFPPASLPPFSPSCPMQTTYHTGLPRRLQIWGHRGSRLLEPGPLSAPPLRYLDLKISGGDAAQDPPGLESHDPVAAC